MRCLPLRLTKLIGLLVITAFFVGNVTYTYAQDSCDRIVVDRAEVFGTDFAHVDAAAKRLRQTGAEVRIRTLISYVPAGSLDTRAEQLIQECPAWRDSNGNRKADLLLLMIAINERKTGIYYGARWNSALDNTWLAIQTDRMNPHFREAKFGAGFVAGMQAIEERIQGASNSAAVPPIQKNQPSPIPQASSAPTVESRPKPVPTNKSYTIRIPTAGPIQYDNLRSVYQPAPSVERSQPSKIPGGLLSLLLVVGLVGGGGYGVYQYRLELLRRRAAQQQARLAKQRAVEYIIVLPERTEHLEARVTNMVAQVSAEDATPLTTSLATAQELVNTLLLDFGERSDLDPERRRLKVAEYDQIAAAYQKICETGQRAAQAAEALETQLASLDEAIQRTPQAIVAGKAAIEQAQTTISAIAAQGFKTRAAHELLSEAQTHLTEAEQAIQERRFMLAATLTDTAEQQTRQAMARAQLLPQLKQQAETAVRALAQRLHTTADQIVTARQILDEISRIAAAQCWHPLIGNPNQAEQRVVQSRQTLDLTRGMITMEQQAWQSALEHIAQASLWLDEAEHLTGCIVARKRQLEAAIREAPGLIEQAQAALAAAEAYTRRYDLDIRDSIWDELRSVANEIEAARVALSMPKPDYLQVVAQAQQAQRTANQLQRQAQAEHEEQERLRQQAYAAYRDAERMIEKTHTYIAGHSGDVGYGTKEMIADAEHDLAQAAHTATLHMRIGYAERAMVQAESAYDRARREVADAETERRRERERRQARHRSSSRSSDSSSGGSSSSSSSGGGSSSW